MPNHDAPTMKRKRTDAEIWGAMHAQAIELHDDYIDTLVQHISVIIRMFELEESNGLGELIKLRDVMVARLRRRAAR